jgi:hypothetical protein
MGVQTVGKDTLPAAPWIGARVHMAVAQSVASGTDTVLVKFDSKDEDTVGGYSTLTGLFTCPFAGKYLVTWRVSFGSGTSTYLTRLRKNGVNALDGTRMTTDEPQLTGSVVVSCAASDTLGVGVYQGTGSAQNTLLAGDCSAEFTWQSVFCSDPNHKANSAWPGWNDGTPAQSDTGLDVEAIVPPPVAL